MTLNTTHTARAPEGRLNFKAALLRLVPQSISTKSRGLAVPEVSSPTHSSPRIGSYWNDAQDVTRAHSFEQARPTVNEDHHNQAEDTDVLERVLVPTTRDLEVTSEVSNNSLGAKKDTVDTEERRMEVDIVELFQDAINPAKPNKAAATGNAAKPHPENSPLRCIRSTQAASFEDATEPLPGNVPLRRPVSYTHAPKIAGARAPKAVPHRPAPSPPDALASKKRGHGKESFPAAPCLESNMTKLQELKWKLEAGTLSFEDELVIGRLAFGNEHRQTQSRQTSTSSFPREQQASRLAPQHIQDSCLQQLLRHKALKLVQSDASYPQARDYHTEALSTVEDKNVKPRQPSKTVASSNSSRAGMRQRESQPARSVHVKPSPWFSGRLFTPTRRTKYLEHQPWYLRHLKNLKNSQRPVTNPALNPFAEPLEWDFKLAKCEPRVEEGEFQWLRWVFAGPQIERGSGVLIAGMAPASKPLTSFDSNMAM